MSEKYKAPDDVWPKKGSSYGGTQVGYLVEARLAYHIPQNVAGMVLDTRWQRVSFHESPIGVPGERLPGFLAVAGLLTYPQAEALRWWFIATAEHQRSAMCVETRIVKCELKASYEYSQVSAHKVIGGEDRSSLMPDWGSKKPEATAPEAAING